MIIEVVYVRVLTHSVCVDCSYDNQAGRIYFHCQNLHKSCTFFSKAKSVPMARQTHSNVCILPTNVFWNSAAAAAAAAQHKMNGNACACKNRLELFELLNTIHACITQPIAWKSGVAAALLSRVAFRVEHVRWKPPGNFEAL